MVWAPVAPCHLGHSESWAVLSLPETGSSFFFWIFIFKQEVLWFRSMERHWCRVWVSVSDAVIDCHDQKRLKEGLFLAHGS